MSSNSSNTNTTKTPGLDMNDDSNLELYSQLLLFKNSCSPEELLWQDPDRDLKRAIQSIAHKLDLEYEYSLQTRIVRISRSNALDDRMDATVDDGFPEFMESLREQNDPIISMNNTNQPDNSLRSASISQSDHCLPSTTATSGSLLQYQDPSTFPTNTFFQELDAPPPTEFLPDLLFEGTNTLSELPGQDLLQWFTEKHYPSFAAANKDDDIHVQTSGPLANHASETQPPAAAINESIQVTQDFDYSDASLKPKNERFFCTDFPPCSLSFARPEHLARHLRKHTGERPFQCHCGRRFSRLDNLRQHTQTVHCDEEIPADSTGYRFRRQIRTDRVRRQAKHKPSDQALPYQYPSRRNSMSNMSEGWASSPNQPMSRTGSMSSMQSERGRTRITNMFSRRSSIHSQASAGYQELVFDSKSVNSESQTSVTSGRQGPLDSVAIATMNAVKRIGACWRCKFLRKSCSVESPCELCPKGRTRSNWDAVGCKRGALKASMPPIKLCDYLLHKTRLTELNAAELLPVDYQNHLERRERYLRGLPLPGESYTRLMPDKILGLSLSLFESMRVPVLQNPALVPLNDCVLAIVWELDDQRSFNYIDELLGGQGFETFVKLLFFSASYQSMLDSDQLIAQSLICLRIGLEALGSCQREIHKYSHAICNEYVCQNPYFSDLDMSISLYLDELSRVFFKKENLKSREKYWLSTFYSFCIQAVLRRILRKIRSDQEGLPDIPQFSATYQYLHVAINLFIASSGSYDPLDDESTPTDSAYSRAITSLHRLLEESGDRPASSASYLRQLFEIEDNSYKPTGMRLHSGSFTPLPQHAQAPMHLIDGDAPALPSFPGWGSDQSDGAKLACWEHGCNGLPCLW